MNSSASACCRLSARATACLTSPDTVDPSTVSMTYEGIDAIRHALGEVVGHVQPPSHAVDPGRLVVGIALGRRRAPQGLAEDCLSAGEAGGVDLR